MGVQNTVFRQSKEEAMAERARLKKLKPKKKGGKYWSKEAQEKELVVETPELEGPDRDKDEL